MFCLDMQLDTCLYFSVLGESPPGLLSRRVLDKCAAKISLAHGW